MGRLFLAIAALSGAAAVGFAAYVIAQWPGTPRWLSRELDWMFRDSPRAFTGSDFARLVVFDPGFVWVVACLLLAAFCMWRARRMPTPFAAPFRRTFEESGSDGWRRGAVFWWCAAGLAVFAAWPGVLESCFNVLSARPPRTWPGNPADQAVAGILLHGAVLLVLVTLLVAGALLLRRAFRSIGSDTRGIILAVVIAGVDCLLLTAALFIAVAANNP